MEQRLGETKNGWNGGLSDLDGFMNSKKELIEIRLFKKSLYYKAME
jgi:hypothetical protein